MCESVGVWLMCLMMQFIAGLLSMFGIEVEWEVRRDHSAVIEIEEIETEGCWVYGGYCND